ncbi:arylesterase [Mucilaginibacter sp. UR6-11]|uniref:arylesterase n=1 Tax=Mucilaginibacter sp. UR6-11 TaxID=1435644 RepID=UPI001E45F7CD|nr:arylesterase [Mucilaginibacter sp. UR6-11]MCC8427155.1 arylesterase [Mucilaginibacter sp. UR6-11]
MKNILFFGDSLTAGYGLANADVDSFPALIQHKIDELELNYKVINAGLSGDTTRGGLSRLDYWLSRPVAVLVLELGINDAIRNVPVTTIQQNLQQIIDKVKTKFPNVKIALMGMQLPVFIPGNRAVEFRNLFGAIADKNNLAFVPFFLDGVADKQHLNLADGLHPSAEGYKVIAENVWPVIKGLLSEP